MSQLIPLFVYLSILVLVLRWHRSVVYFLALTAPFYFDEFQCVYLKLQVFGVHLTMKPFLFVTIFLACLSFLKMFRDGVSFKEVQPSSMVAFLGFGLFCVLSYYFNSVMGGKFSTELNILFNASLLFFVPYFCQKEGLRIKPLLSYLSVAVITISGYVVISFFVSCNVFNLQGFATFMMMAIPFLLFGFLLSRDKRIVSFFGATICLAYLAMFLTLSKSAWSGFAVSYCVFVFMVVGKRDLSVKRRLFVVCSFILCVFLFFICVEPVRNEMRSFFSIVSELAEGSVIKDPYFADMRNTFLLKFSLFLGHERTILWRKGLYLFAKAPFTGYGLNYIVVEGMPGLHNIFLRVLLASGLMGFIFFMYAVYLTASRAWKKMENAKNGEVRLFYLACWISVLSWLIQGLSQTIINDYIVWFVMALAFVAPKNLIVENG